LIPPSGVVLYGPPAAGKDTITRELTITWPRYTAFRRLKAGNGNNHGYRIVDQAVLDDLDAAGQLLYLNRRYGNTYAVDRPELDRLREAARTPILHLGQLDGVEAVTTYPIRWVRVLLWCPRAITEQRAIARGNADALERLAAWDQTLADLTEHPAALFDQLIRTDRTDPRAAALSIHQCLTSTDGLPPRATVDLLVGDQS